VIDQADERLREFITATVGPAVPVSSGPPGGGASGRAVNCYLLEVVPAPAERSVRRPPLQVALRYLITTWDDDHLAAHRLLGQLLFAAMADDALDVEREALDAASWTALGTPPRPAFVLRVPVRVERPERTAPRVREPLHVEIGLAQRLTGVVVGPGDTPIMNARVEAVGLDAITTTDAAGRFQLPAPPASGPPLRVRVAARGVHTEVVHDTADGGDGVLTIRLLIPES
jgi:hypothetical protein